MVRCENPMARLYIVFTLETKYTHHSLDELCSAHLFKKYTEHQTLTFE